LDVAGFTRIDEKTLWESIRNTGLPLGEWTARSEASTGNPTLHLYAEAYEQLDPSQVAQELHSKLRQADGFYSDLESMLEIRPMRVTLLAPGTFDRLYTERHERGMELADLQPPRVNPDQESIKDLLRLSALLGRDE
jgi:hypothetical protein